MAGIGQVPGPRLMTSNRKAEMMHPARASTEAGRDRELLRLPGGSGRDLRSSLPLARLPAIPQVLVRLLELCQDDTAGVSELADLFGSDVALAARVMEIASSALHHGRQKPASLEQSLIRLGMSMVKTIVINESIFQIFRRIGNERDFDLSRFWAHSLRCALLARSLARATGQADYDMVYLAGLLHDVGQLAMLTAEPSAYIPLFLTHENTNDLCLREQAMFDLTHAEVGAWLVEKWELDPLLSDCVLYHHDCPERLVGSHPLIRCVCLADRLACLGGGDPAQSDEAMAESLFETAIDLSVLVSGCEEELRETARQLGIDPDAASSTAPASKASGVLIVDPLPDTPAAGGATDEAPVQINALLSEMLSLCCPAAHRIPPIEIRTDFCPELPEVRTGGDRLRQLLASLLHNAVDALSSLGGIIRASTSPWSDGAIPTHAEIRIEHSGPASLGDELDRRRWPDSGAAIVAPMVRELGALINCRSDERGTCFQILLPLGK